MSAVGGARDRADGVSRRAVERRKRWNGMFLGAESWWKRGGRRGRRRSALYNDDGGLYVKGGGATLAPPAEYQCGWDGEGMEWLTACPDISPRRTQADRQSQAYRRVGTACIDSTPPPSSHQLTRLSITRDEAKDAVSIAEEAITDGQRPRVQHHTAKGFSSVRRRRN